MRRRPEQQEPHRDDLPVHPKRRRVLGAAGAMFAALALPGIGRAQEYPNKIIRVIVAGSPGAALDLVGRSYADGIMQQFGKSVVVENKPGAGMRVGAEYVAKSPPDGYTILCAASTPLNQAPVVFRNPGFEPLKDLHYIAAIDNGPLIIVTHPDFPAKTTRELVEIAQKRTVTFSTWGQGSYAHLIAGEMNRLYNTKFEPVHYKSAAQLIQDVAAGRVDATVNVYGVLLPLIQAGKLRALSVAKGSRQRELPDVPTIREEGFDGAFFRLGGYFIFAVPGGTPMPIVRQLSDAFQKAGKSPRVEKLHESLRVDPRILTTDEAQSMMNSESSAWLSVTKSLGVSLD